MRKNRARAKLEEGKLVLASWLGFYAPAVVEILGAAGIDCVLLDAEHGGLTQSDVETMVRAAEAFDITPIVRVPNHLPSTIYGYLDRGAQGVIVPHVNTKKDAENAAAAARYHPLGRRGFQASGRVVRWGTMDSREYFRRANEEVLVIALIEEIEGMRNLDEILSVDGIDMIMLGPGDLSQSMGWATPERLRDAMSDIIRRAADHGKWVTQGNVSLHGDDDALHYLRLGCRFWDITTQSLLVRGAREYQEWMKSLGAPL